MEFQLQSSPENRLSEDEKTSLERDLTMEEVAAVLKATPCFRSAGSDGIPVDMYQFFWPKMKNLIMEEFKLKGFTNQPETA